MSNPFNKLIEAIREEGRFYNEPSFFVGKSNYSKRANINR